MKTQRIYNSPPAGSGGGRNIPPRGFEKWNKYWVEMDGSVRDIGGKPGCFVKFGNSETQFSGVLRGGNLFQYKKGDKVFARIDNVFFGSRQQVWKFDLSRAEDQKIRFPLIRNGFIVIPKEIFGAETDAVAPESWAKYIQPQTAELEWPDPLVQGFFSDSKQKQLLIGPAGFPQIIKDISTGKPIKLIIGEKQKVMHPLFPGVAIGIANLGNYESYFQEGDQAEFMLSHKHEWDGQEDLFSSALRGRLEFSIKVSPAEAEEKLVTKTGLPNALIEIIQSWQGRRENQVELVLVKDRGVSGLGRFEQFWDVAHPDFPDHVIGFVSILVWFKPEAGDRVICVTPHYEERLALKTASSCGICFSHRPRELSPGQVIIGQIEPKEEDPRFKRPNVTSIWIKGCHCAAVPDILLAGRQPQESLQFRILGKHGYMGAIAVPQDSYEIILAFQQQLLAGIEAEVLTDYQEFTDYGYGANWLFHGYRIRMNMNGLTVEGFIPSPDLPIVGLAPGQKVIVMEQNWSYRETQILVADIIKKQVKLCFVGEVK